MKTKLFLDDVRQPWDKSWDLVKNALEFRTHITKMFKETNKIPEWVSFDHDLHYEHYLPANTDAATYNLQYSKFKHETGLDCAKWLCTFCVDNEIPLPKIHVHSANKVGANNIAFEISNFSMFYYGEEITITPAPFGFWTPNLD